MGLCISKLPARMVNYEKLIFAVHKKANNHHFLKKIKYKLLQPTADNNSVPCETVSMKTKSWWPKGSMCTHISDCNKTSRNKMSWGVVRVTEELMGYRAENNNKKLCFDAFNNRHNQSKRTPAGQFVTPMRKRCWHISYHR